MVLKREKHLELEERIFAERSRGVPFVLDKPLRVIDLFSGAGGLTLGFTQAVGHAFQPIWANDFDEAAVATYNENFGPHCVSGDILNILSDPKVKIPRAEIVIGGPPCQGFSLLNKNRNGDERRHLWKPFFEVVSRAKAEIFLMENVPQLLGSEEYQEIIERAVAMGFKVAAAKLCAADYGAPQTRWRAFILGCRFADPSTFFPPRKTHFNPSDKRVHESKAQFSLDLLPKAKPWRTVRDAIEDLPIPEGTEVKRCPAPLNLHFGRKPTLTSLRRYKAIPEQGMNRFDLQKKALHLTPLCWINKVSGGTDLFGRLWWDKPAFTIRTEFFKPEKGRYLHPVQHRPITHREAARLQSFPDSFKFIGSKIEIAKQIGNAVPPLLAARIADCILALYLSSEKISVRSLNSKAAKRTHEKRKERQHRSRKSREVHCA